MNLDFLAVGAHADDIEIGCGGTVAKLVSLGRSGALLDLTDASMGTRGTSADRLLEAEKARELLGVPGPRLNLGLPDGRLRPHDPEVVLALVEVFRRLRPRVVFTHPAVDRHPDHEAACSLVLEAAFKAGLARHPPEGLGAWRPARVFHWMGARSPEPDFCVDVTGFWETRLRALSAYPSQFGRREGEAETPISGDAFQEMLEARARHLGSRIRALRAEGFTCQEIPEVVDPCALSAREF